MARARFISRHNEPSASTSLSAMGRACAVLCSTLVLGGLSLAALSPEVLISVDAVAPDIAGRFREPAGFQAAASGQYFVFDRRGHTVFGLDAARTSAWPIVEIGGEPGRIIGPTALSVAP